MIGDAFVRCVLLVGLIIGDSASLGWEVSRLVWTERSRSCLLISALPAAHASTKLNVLGAFAWAEGSVAPIVGRWRSACNPTLRYLCGPTAAITSHGNEGVKKVMLFGNRAQTKEPGTDQ